MKILYELVITEETGFTASDFPDRFEILRPGKTPLVFKPVAINLQTVYSRLNEAEWILKKVFTNDPLNATIDKYFERHVQ